MRFFLHFFFQSIFSVTHISQRAAAGGTPGGSNTQLQYNNSGAFGGVSGATWNGTRLNAPSLQGVTQVSTNPFTFTTAMTTLLVNTGQLNSVVNLPQASTCGGKIINIVNADGSGTTSITPTPFAGDTIAGNFTALSTNPYDGLTLISDGVDKWWPVIASPTDLYTGSPINGMDAGAVLYNNGGYLDGDTSFLYDGQAVSFPPGILSNPGVRFSSASGMMEETTNQINLVANSLRSATFTDTSFIFYPDAVQPVTITSGGDLEAGGLTIIGDAVVKGNLYGGTLNVRDPLGNLIYALPGADGTAGYVLQTDGAGTVSWEAVTAANANYLYDTAGTPVISVDGVNRIIYAVDGTTEHIDWTGSVSATAYLSFASNKVSLFNDAAYFDNTGALTIGGTAGVSASGGTISASQLTATSAADLPNFYTSGSGIAFFGVTPQSSQLNTGVTAASFTANTSAIADDSATWDGYTMGQVVAALRAYGLLQ